MQFPRYKPGPVEYWLAEAGTQFVNGCIASFKIGVSVGVLGGSGGVAANELGQKVSPLMNAVFAIGGIIGTCAAGGAAQVHDWHKSNPFPNPYPKPPAP